MLVLCMKTNVEERKKLNNDKTALSEKKGGCWSIFNCCSCGTNQGAEEEINLNNGNIEEKIEEKINESNIKNDNNNQNLSNSLVIKEEIKSNVLVEKNSQSFKENNINYSQNNYIDGSLCEKEKNIEEIKSAEKQSLVNISEEENKNKDIFTNIANGKKKETCIMKKEEINENLVNNDKNINKSNFTPLENIQLIEFNNSYVKEYARKNGLNINDNFDLSALKQQNTFNNNISNNINNNNLNSNININNGKRTIVEVKEQGENEKKDMEKDDSFFTMSGIIQGTHFNNNKNIDIINKGNNNNNFDLKPIELIQPQDINKVNLNNNNFEFTPIKLINLSGFNNSIDYKNTNLIDSKRHKGTIMVNKGIKSDIIEEEEKELVPEREKEDMDEGRIGFDGKYSNIKKEKINENIVNKDGNINNNFKGNKGSGDDFFIKGDGMNYSMYVGTIRLNKPDNKSFCSGKDKKIEFTLQFKREQKGKEDCLKEYKMTLERVGEGELKVTMHDVKNKTDIEVKILNNETVKENIKKDFEKIVDKIARSENKKNIIDLILSTVKNNFFVDNLKKLNLSDDIIKEIVPEPFLDYYNATHEKGKVIKKYDFYMSGIIEGNKSNNNKNIDIINNNPNNNIINNPNNNIINKGNINNGERTIVEVKKQGENEKKDMEKDNGFFEMSGIIEGNKSNNNNFEFKHLGLIAFKNIDINNNNPNNNIDLANDKKKETCIIEKGEIDKNIANKNKNVNTINNLKEKNNNIILNSVKMIKDASSKGGENKDDIKNSNNREIKNNNLDVEEGKLATCNNQ